MRTESSTRFDQLQEALIRLTEHSSGSTGRFNSLEAALTQVAQTQATLQGNVSTLVTGLDGLRKDVMARNLPAAMDERDSKVAKKG